MISGLDRQKFTGLTEAGSTLENSDYLSRIARTARILVANAHDRKEPHGRADFIEGSTTIMAGWVSRAFDARFSERNVPVIGIGAMSQCLYILNGSFEGKIRELGPDGLARNFASFSLGAYDPLPDTLLIESNTSLIPARVNSESDCIYMLVPLQRS